MYASGTPVGAPAEAGMYKNPVVALVDSAASVPTITLGVVEVVIKIPACPLVLSTRFGTVPEPVLNVSTKPPNVPLL